MYMQKTISILTPNLDLNLLDFISLCIVGKNVSKFEKDHYTEGWLDLYFIRIFVENGNFLLYINIRILERFESFLTSS